MSCKRLISNFDFYLAHEIILEINFNAAVAIPAAPETINHNGIFCLIVQCPLDSTPLIQTHVLKFVQIMDTINKEKTYRLLA